MYEVAQLNAHLPQIMTRCGTPKMNFTKILSLHYVCLTMCTTTNFFPEFGFFFFLIPLFQTTNTKILQKIDDIKLAFTLDNQTHRNNASKKHDFHID